MVEPIVYLLQLFFGEGEMHIFFGEGEMDIFCRYKVSRSVQSGMCYLQKNAMLAIASP